MRVGLIQTTLSDDPVANLPLVQSAVAEAAAGGASLVLTPEFTNCISSSRTRQLEVLHTEPADPTLSALRAQANELGVWLSIGSLALKIDDDSGRFSNRSYVIGPDGRIAAWYDKIHMFDVEISETESYRESAGYRAGDRAVLADVGGVTVGMTVCYDLRFPHLFRQLAQAGADILTVPAAFSPWGEVMVDAGTEAGVSFVDLDLEDVRSARKRMPSLFHDRPFDAPA